MAYRDAKQEIVQGYRRNENGWQIIANHEIYGVTPSMVDWWWDNTDTTERYKLWHPTDHISFQWLVAPAHYGHVGAVQRIEEFLNGIPATPTTLEIRWEDPKDADAEYSHVLLGTVTGNPKGTLMHEYEAAPFGLRMRSHFQLAAETPEEIVAALYEHNKQEMVRFSLFLPDLYHSSISAK